MATDASPDARFRDWATRVVQWDPARNALKRGAHRYAAARGRLLELRDAVPEIGNIYAASSPKAGSQWMKALFDHPVVRAHTGLFTLPQLDYQLERRTFPPGTFVPGVYTSYPEFQALRAPRPHRVVYMFRDPRDLIVSGYYAAVETHRPTHLAEVERFRREIRALPLDAGLLALIRAAAPRLYEIESWIGVRDEAVATFRLEDIEADPERWVVRMLDHCGVRLSADELARLLGDVSRSALQERDLAQREAGAESHYRVDQKGFRELFGPEHHQALDEVAPGLVERLGYLDDVTNRARRH
ncbi:MAG TPA: sulfotransferase domain-containing protein [Marmoricola sp.]|nr:sulfotransferase domain-containing protein [Marmoricola sp.]